MATVITAANSGASGVFFLWSLHKECFFVLAPRYRCLWNTDGFCVPDRRKLSRTNDLENLDLGLFDRCFGSATFNGSGKSK